MKLQPLKLRRGDESPRVMVAVVAESELTPYAAAPALLLGANELAQLKRMTLAPKRQSFLLGRLAAKTALGAMLGEPDFSLIEIQPGVFGQPLVRHPRALGVDVTLSHSHGLAVALAFPSAVPMGVDLESVAQDVVPVLLAEMNLSDEEKRWCAAVNAASACAVLWGAREALGKAMKTGVHSPLGVLAASDIKRVPKTFGINAWHGSYANFAQFHWYAQIVGERVLTIALPRAVDLEQGVQL